MSAKRGNPKWTKGTSGNPGGRKSLPLDIVALCRETGRESIETLIAIQNDPKAPPVARIKAAETLLNRGWGTAPQTVKIEGEMVFHQKRIEVVLPTKE